MASTKDLLTAAQDYAHSVKIGEPKSRVQMLKDALYDYQVSHCVHTKKVKVCDSFGRFFELDAPCGICYHCTSTRSNEWFTRMLHETKAHPYVYFITLDYKPYATFELIPEKLRDAGWHYDNLNSRGTLAWHPCLLRIEHLQMFIRQLRDDMRAAGRGKQPLRYFACGQYGSKWGRCHFHVILWSDYAVERSWIERAWSVRSGRKNMTWQSIGDNIDFVDLNANGTIGRTSEGMSAKYAFNYVCRYVGRLDEYENSTRLRLYFDSVRAFGVPFDLVRSPRICKRLLDFNYSSWVAYQRRQDAANISNIIVESGHLAETRDLRSTLYEDYLSTSYALSSPAEQLLSLDFGNFCKLFRSFTTCSRASGIGSSYITDEFIERLAYGNSKIIDNTYGTLVCPKYYMRKVSELLQGYRISTSSGKTTRPHTAFVKGNYEISFETISKLPVSVYTNPLSVVYKLDDKGVRSLRSCDFHECIKHLPTGTVYVPVLEDEHLCSPQGKYEFVLPRVSLYAYRYNRSSRKYDPVVGDCGPLRYSTEQVLKAWYNNICFEEMRMDKLASTAKERLELYLAAQNLVDQVSEHSFDSMIIESFDLAERERKAMHDEYLKKKYQRKINHF